MDAFQVDYSCEYQYLQLSILADHILQHHLQFC